MAIVSPRVGHSFQYWNSDGAAESQSPSGNNQIAPAGTALSVQMLLPVRTSRPLTRPSTLSWARTRSAWLVTGSSPDSVQLRGL
jgi:hypothetical protein